MDFTRLFDILPYQQARYPRKEALCWKENGHWRHWSTESALEAIQNLSAGLLHLGFQRGDRVGILARRNGPPYNFADNALLQLGIIPVPIHATARTDEIALIASDASLKGCFIGDEILWRKWKESGAAAPQLIALERMEGLLFWEDLAEKATPEHLLQVRQIADSIRPEDLATILYTSGSTGSPKGVMLSHANIVSNIKAVLAIVPVHEKTVAISILPLSHIFERMVTNVYMAAGVSLWYSDWQGDLNADMQHIRPHFFTAVPRVLERMHERLIETRDKAPFPVKKLMDWALALGERYPSMGTSNMALDYRVKLWLANLLVYRLWRKALGGRIRGIAVGAAALQPRLGRLFSAAGMSVREGYGLTETSPVVSFNRFEPGGVHFGTVGIPAPGVEVRIDQPDAEGQGEIQVRGPNVLMGYWNAPDITQAQFTADGWLKTGDSGLFMHKRFLKITGRQRDFFKTSSGKFVSPLFIEQKFLESPLVDQILVVGLNRPWPSAVIVPDFKHLESVCRDQKIHWTAPQFMVLNPKVEKIFAAEMEKINASLGTVEKIRTFRLSHEPWTVDNGLLTATMKLKRAEISKKMEKEIEEMYAPAVDLDENKAREEI